MNPEAKAKWIEALRSGKYKQGRGALRNGDTFCCLGVLCDISGVAKWDVTRYDGELYMPPKSVREWAGLDGYPVYLDGPTGDDVSHLNDQMGLSFEEIADLIEKI